MPPKATTPQSLSKKKHEEEKPEVPLQAIIIADSFDQRFMPITLERPRCLIPLANKPLLEYTIEFLTASSVEEIHVFCCAHSDQIENYIRQSRWSKQSSPVKIMTIISQECLSLGDALREIDAKSIVRGDFILVNGDVVSNIDLQEVLKEHKERRIKDKNALMTLVMKKVSCDHACRTFDDDGVFILNGQTREVLYYDTVEDENKKNVLIDMEFLKDPVAEIDIRYDLFDCHVDICSPEVPSLFTENFDYQDIRGDFVRGILTSDLLGYRIFVYVLEKGYALRVRNTSLYDTVSKDVMHRWNFPFVPDINMSDNSDFTYHRRHIYLEQNITLGRTAILQKNVMIGKGTTVGDDSIIQDSVIGRNCVIGTGVKLYGSYLFDNVIIENNSSLCQSVVANDAVIKENVLIESGCLLGDKVVVGPNVTLPQFTRLSRRRITRKRTVSFSTDKEEDSPDINGTFHELEFFDTKQVGLQGKGYIYSEPIENFDNGEQYQKHLNILKARCIGSNKSQFVYADDDSTTDESDMESEPDLDEIDKFSRETTDTITRAIANNHSMDDTALEINGLKFAFNTTFKDFYYAAVPAILNACWTKETGTSKIDKKKIMSVISKWGKLLSKFVYSKNDQLEIIFVMQEYCTTKQEFVQFFSFTLQLLYQVDVLEEEALLDWYNSKYWNKADEVLRKLRTQATKFMDWLQRDEDEDED